MRLQSDLPPGLHLLCEFRFGTEKGLVNAFFTPFAVTPVPVMSMRQAGGGTAGTTNINGKSIINIPQTTNDMQTNIIEHRLSTL